MRGGGFEPGEGEVGEEGESPGKGEKAKPRMNVVSGTSDQDDRGPKHSHPLVSLHDLLPNLFR